MENVVSRVRNFMEQHKLPVGGYIPRKMWEVEDCGGGVISSDNETLQGSEMGIAVEPIAKVCLALENNLLDANAKSNAYKELVYNVMRDAEVKAAIVRMTSNPERHVDQSFFDDLAELGADIDSLIAAFPQYGIEALLDCIVTSCGKLGFLDQYSRFGSPTIQSDLAAFEDKINDTASSNLENLATMAMRIYNFFVSKNIVSYHPDFLNDEGAPTGYNKVVSAGDGDICTDDTFWDIKCCKESSIRSAWNQYCMQLMCYYVMAKESGNSIYANLHKIGIYNPRTDTAYTYDVSKLDPEIYRIIREEVCGFESA